LSHRHDSILKYLPPYAWISVGILLLLLLGALIRPLLPGARPKRDLSTPASRLVGHWMLHSGSDVPSSHLFFGPTIEMQEQRGTACMVDTDGGLTFKGYYKVVSQYKHGLDMTIQQELGANLSRKVVMTISHDGQLGRYRYNLLDTELDLRMAYLDAQEEPPPGFAEGLKALAKEKK
jgi:hypothetical protein